jgi:protein AaeX
MRYAEVNLFGVYVSPVFPMLLAAWVLLVPLRRLADRTALFRYVWHPALFLFAVYAILLSAIVLICGAV